MASAPDQKQSLFDLSRQIPNPEQFAKLQEDIDGMDARAAVLIFAALIDSFLETAIKTNFVSMGKKKSDLIFRSAGAPLSDLASKIAIAHALGIYDDEHRTQADRVRSIRNAFAHAVLPISFEDPTVSAECNKLDPARLIAGEYQPVKNTPRERYSTVASVLSLTAMRYTRRRVKTRLSGVEP